MSVINVGDMERTIARLRSEVAYYVDREDTIVRALAPVSDGGQYRADIVSAIGRVVAERDKSREDMRLMHADATRVMSQIVSERDEARAEVDMEREVHAVTHGALLAALAEIDTLRLLVVAGRVEMRERAAEVAEDCDHDNCAAAIRALDPVPAAKP